MRKAIVMAGGQGSRLQPLTLTRPKPLVPVANRPVMTHILEWLRDHGFSEVLVTLHYRADDIRRAFGDGRTLGLKITYRVEEKPLGTAGSVKYAEDWIGGEPFLVASGDALTDVDLDALRQRHRETGAWLTLGLKQVQDPSQYGVVELDERGKVARFQEKPGRGQAFSNLANTGIYCIEPQVLERVPNGRAYDWSRDVFPQLMAEGLPLFGHSLDGYWCDIGSMSDYRRGQRDALEGVVRVALPGTTMRPRIWIGPNVRIAPGVVIEGPALLGAGCRLERDALVLPGSILGEQTVVRTGACVWNAVVGSDCEIGAGAVVRDCVVGEETRIGSGCSVSEGAVIGRGCRLIGRIRIGEGQRVEPDQVLSGTPPAGDLTRSTPPRRARLPLSMPPSGDLLAPAGS
jgi:mannose-1-phosphate guanylyltransferase/phosphomannomutase